MEKRMKMKLLDYTLISLLAGMAAPVAVAGEGDGSGVPAPSPAQPAGETARAQAAGAHSLDCNDSGCADGEGLLFRLRTRSYDRPVSVGTSRKSTSEELQPDRRATIAAEKPGRAVVVGKWSVDLPNGGVIWATEDPNLGVPEFTLSASSLVPFDGSRITRPVRFYAYNNYPAFIERVEVLVYRASDADLVAPLAKIEMPVAAVSEVEWDGSLPSGFKARPGDELVYVARAYAADGAYDETWPRRMQLVTPEEAERGRQLQRNATEKQFGVAMGADEAERASQIDTIFGQNTLRLQNIPIYGSRVRIHGRNIPEGMLVTINGRNHPVDLERKLVAEYLMPIGQHRFDLVLKDRDGREVTHSLEVDVSGRYSFAVAIADLTLSGNKVTGSIEPLAGDERYDDSFLVEGRLAFYLKGKIKGKYLVTAQADTREREISRLFKGFWDADPQDIFRRLDPDAYYPVYGDDSTTYRDVDTMGRLYVRVDWEKNQVLWGNYHTGITGTEYAQYSRSLYGAAASMRSRRTTAYGEPGSELRVFASEAQTAPGHSEFLGTGGSLYYLRHTDILPGSDKVVLEIRDRTTGRVEKRVELLRGADYEIDEFQGRILLTRPLAQVTRENIPTLTMDSPLDGFTQVLLVDYEYIPSGFDPDEVTAGFRGRHWLGDHVAVGATWVEENRAGDDYSLMGADITLQAGRGTYLKVEHSRTEATSAPVFYSDNGGLSFTEINSGLDSREGEATAVEARANFKELGWTALDWSVGAWWRRADAGYSIARFDIGADVKEYGVEVLGQFSPSFNLYGRYTRAERGAEALGQAQLTGEWRINDNATLSAELRRVEEERTSGDATGTLAALQYRHRFGTRLELWAAGQVTVDDDGGAYDDNDAFRVGGKYLFGDLSSVGAELGTGDRGDAARIDAEYRLTPDHTFYGAYTYSTDRSDYDPLFRDRLHNGWTLGQRWRLSNQVNMFNESQYLKAPNESGLAHTFGMDFYPGLGWNLGFTLQDAELERLSDGAVIDRRAISLHGGRTSEATQWQSKLEWRKDTGAEQREQWVTTNRLMHKVNDSLRVAARFNYSKTEDELNPQAGAKFIEGNVGFAWRPWNTTRYALLGKYTYLYDVSTLGQVGPNVANYDQKSHVFSMEGVWNPDDNWELAGKLMRRKGSVRLGRLEGEWADSTATFAAVQVRREFAEDWHALAEHRWLDVKHGGTRCGWLVGIDRDIGRNFRVGVGYNFTEFSDDLTDFDYDHKGWFINFVGSY